MRNYLADKSAFFFFDNYKLFRFDVPADVPQRLLSPILFLLYIAVAAWCNGHSPGLELLAQLVRIQWRPTQLKSLKENFAADPLAWRNKAISGERLKTIRRYPVFGTVTSSAIDPLYPKGDDEPHNLHNGSTIRWTRGLLSP
jgi:hypothetical protein